MNLPIRHPFRWAALLLVAVVAAGAGGIAFGRLRSGVTVRVTNVPTPSAADAAACKKLAAVLPSTIGDGLKTRTVAPDSPLLSAWGTPAVVLRCGVGYPPNFASSTVASDVSGVLWVSTQIDDAVIYTAAYRIPRVSIAVPSHYTQSFDILSSLSDALEQTTQGH